MSARPLVAVQGIDGSEAGSANLPAVFSAPIRVDIVKTIHTHMAKNRRQAIAVSREAGHQTSAESWGTGRAVARIPRVGGGGTHRSGQGAFGNMCRGGRMFAPTKVYRKFHRKINQGLRRHATVSSIAASALPALVMARGHRIDAIPEVPLVVAAGAEQLKKTKDAAALLKSVGADADVAKVKDSRKVRTGKGKMRNRRFRQRRGPLVIYANDDGITKAFRNLPGVELCNVNRLNLLQLAPGGHVGRLCIWTQPALESLDKVFGTEEVASEQKKGYTLPRSIMANADITRIINSDEVQSVVREKRTHNTHVTQRKNPLKNINVMLRLNPYAKAAKRAAARAEEENLKKKAAKKGLSEKQRATLRKYRRDGQAFYKKLSAEQ
eukprot:Clim_evm75s11 gene=Clim_evmTU75s11